MEDDCKGSTAGYNDWLALFLDKTTDADKCEKICVADGSVKENTEEGKEASAYTTNLLEGNTVYLEYDQETLDEYGRTLCYVYLHDKSTMVNEILLKNGYARTMTIEPNTKYKERLAAAELLAKETKAGFWGTGFFH